MKKQTLLSVVVLSVCFTGISRADEKSLPAPIALSGSWQLLAGHETDDVAADPARFSGWTPVEVPKVVMNTKGGCVWYMRKLQIPAAAAGFDCELFFERITWRADVWLNGLKLCSSTDPYSPVRCLAGGAVRAGGENVLVVRVGTLAEVPKAKCGHTLMPAGYDEYGPRGCGILGDSTIRFFNKVRITRIQVLPDLAGKKVNVTVRLEGPVEDANVRMNVFAHHGTTPPDQEQALGTGGITVKLTGGTGEADIQVPLAEVHPWTPETPFLYRLEVRTDVAGKPADGASTRFGMREVAFKPDGFYLNGAKRRLPGANIMGEMPHWAGVNPLDAGFVEERVVAKARRINAVCIRTHGGPVPSAWLDVCDRMGMMVLLEFPATVNCANFDFTGAELAEYKKNLEHQASGVVPHLANHPSVVMWVMTNESLNWQDYERTTLYNLFRRLDPSRPAIRASGDTPDVFDVHNYHGMWKGSAGDFELNARQKLAAARKLGLACMTTEYLEHLGDLRRNREWFGPDVDSPDPAVRARLGEHMADFLAQRAMEQTETCRRLDYAAVMPFGPYFWDDKDGKLNPTGHAVANALAPVGISLDLFNLHFEAGGNLETQLRVMNDTRERVSGKIRCFIVARNPGFDASADIPEVEFEKEVPFEAEPLAQSTIPFTWKLPGSEGGHWLIARLERPGAAPAVSRRPILVLERQKPAGDLKGRKLLIIDSDGAYTAWAAGLGCEILPTNSQPRDAAMVVIAPGAAMTHAFAGLAPQLELYVRDGGRVLVLEQLEWPKLKDPFNIQIERTDYDVDPRTGEAFGGSSRVWRWDERERPVWSGLDDSSLWRWNGAQGRLARINMTSLPARSRILVRYSKNEADNLKSVPVAAVAHCRGEILYFMLETRGRYRREDPDFDPVVERLMLNLLGNWRSKNN